MKKLSSWACLALAALVVVSYWPLVGAVALIVLVTRR